ncbi:MAG: ribonuclease III [Gammaproteobacteria bacterium]|nr:ribonuclease III [Gammaproteobacteria bacterium]MDP2140932.1 ribonuclease III [Gammaproteobacteria bacterium]MDP2349324.1 ribonuclease III [Gammaproteobacteria bacterium]
MTTSVRKLEKGIAYCFSNQSLAELALTHRSANKQNNERLEFLGDAILGFTIADELLRRNPAAPEGELSRLRSQLVNQQKLANIAVQLQLGELLVLGPGELKSGGRRRISILADAVEAVIGAIYLDGGLESCRSVILQLYRDQLEDDSTGIRGKDPKTRLQELLQAKGLELPVYKVLSIGGEAHEQTFVVSCAISMLTEHTIGSGSNRRIAEQQAAKNALQALGL